MSENNNDQKSLILEGEEKLVLGHSYDGIQELDHNLPQWWLWLFYLTIIFAVFYAGYYMVGPGPTLREEMETALAAMHSNKAPDASAEETESIFIEWAQNEAHVKTGQDIFVSKCAACHGDKGQGLVGPNLTDEFWIHGEGKFVSMAKVIREGIMDKGMPPWDQLLTPDEVKSTVAYIIKIHGTNPPGGRPAQGEKYEWKVE